MNIIVTTLLHFNTLFPHKLKMNISAWCKKITFQQNKIEEYNNEMNYTTHK